MPPVAAAAEAVPIYTTADEYRIGPSDELSVVLPYNSELNHDGPVGPDGRFSMPLAGSLPLAGLTTTEAERRIGTALRQAGIVADARPSVSIRRYGATVYVGGEVRTPGAVTLGGQMNPLQAIIVAGGMLDTARSRRIVVIRQQADGRAHAQVLNVRAFAHNGDPAGMMTLQPRDIVFVPKSSIAEVDLFIDQYINKVVPFSRNLNYNFGNNGSTVSSSVGP